MSQIYSLMRQFSGERCKAQCCILGAGPATRFPFRGRLIPILLVENGNMKRRLQLWSVLGLALVALLLPVRGLAATCGGTVDEPEVLKTGDSTTDLEVTG